jgi:hypothetical protein
MKAFSKSFGEHASRTAVDGFLRLADPNRACKRIGKIHTYHSRFIPEGIVKASQTFLRDTNILQKLLITRNTADVTGRKPIAI